MRIIGLLLLFLVNCVTSSTQLLKNQAGLPLLQCNLPVVVAISSNVAPEHKEKIISAICYWNCILNTKAFVYLGEVDFNPTDVQDPHYLVIGYATTSDTPGEFTAARTSYSESFKGCINESKIVIFFSDMTDLNRFETMMRHELGHVLGLAHSGFKEDLMYRKLSTKMPHVLRATRDEVIALKNLYNLGGSCGQAN